MWPGLYWKARRKQRGREGWRWRKLTGKENATNENNENVIETKIILINIILIVDVAIFISKRTWFEKKSFSLIIFQKLVSKILLFR